MDELEGLALAESGLAGAEGVLFGELMEAVGQRCASAISPPLQTLLWRRLRLLACLDFSLDAADREQQLQAEPRLEPGSKGQKIRPIPCGEPLARGELPERLEQVPELHRLRLTANAQTRMKEVGWLASDSVQSVRVLEVIARSRDKGILQTKIASDTGLDAKSVFYYMKPLKARDIISLNVVTLPAPAQPASSAAPKHIKTNMVYLKRFAPAAGEEAAAQASHSGAGTLEDTAPMEARALQFLQESPGGIAAETRCKKHAMFVWQSSLVMPDKNAFKSKVTHMWERVRRQLETRRIVQRVMLRTEDGGGVKREDEDQRVGGGSADAPHSHQQEVVCLKLLDAAAVAAPQQAPARLGLVAQVSMLEQMMREIKQAGRAGVLMADLHRSLGIDTRVAYDLALQLVQFFGVQPSPETVGRNTQYRLTFVSAAPVAALGVEDVDPSSRASQRGNAHVRVDSEHEEVHGAGGARVGATGPGHRQVLTREWVTRQDGWEKGVPCTEQWLRRGNLILEKLTQCSAMTVSDVNRLLNTDEKQHRDKSKMASKIDYKTSHKLLEQLERFKLLKKGSYKIASGGYSRFQTTDMDLFEETRDVDVIHLPHIKADGPEVAAALKGKGKNGLAQHLDVINAAPEIASHIFQQQGRKRGGESEHQESASPDQKLTWQTGAFLNGYVSCKVKRWYSFHKFLVERFLGFRSRPDGGNHGSDQVPPPPPSPGAPPGQGIKKDADAQSGSVSRLSVQEIVEAMPVVLFLHVVGCGECVPGLVDLIARDALIADCDRDVRKLLFRQDYSTNVKLVRHRIKDTLDSLELMGLISTAFGEDEAATAAAVGPGPEKEGGKEGLSSVQPKGKESTIHSANSIELLRTVQVAFAEGSAAVTTEEFVFSCEEDVDNFWRTLAVRSRNQMQNLIKSEEVDSDDAAEQTKMQGRAIQNKAPIFEKFPALTRRKTWSNLAFGDCTAAQREAVMAFLERENELAQNAGLGQVELRSLVCTPEAVALTMRVARDCQLSREVAAKLLSLVDTKSKAPFSEPLLPSVGSRLTQLSARKRQSRQDDALHDENAGAGAKKGYKVDVNNLKRQRKRRTTLEIASDGLAAGGQGRKRAKKVAGSQSGQTDAVVPLEGGSQEIVDADWEESEGEEDGRGGDRAGAGKFPRPRSRRKIWQVEDDLHLLIVYSQAAQLAVTDSGRGAGHGPALKPDKDRATGLKGRVDWKVVAGAVGLKVQQCQRRIKSLSADLPRLRLLYRMTSRGAVETMIGACPALHIEVADMDAEAVCKSMQHVLNNLHLSISTAPIDNLDKNSLPPNLPSTAEEIRSMFAVEALFPARQRRHAWPDATPTQACILDLLFLVLSVQQENYDSELALRLLGRFPEADLERALTLLREKGMIVKRRDGDRSCGLSRLIEELMSPSKAYSVLMTEMRAAARKRKWGLDGAVSGGLVARTAGLLLDKRLKVDTVVPDSLGLTAGSAGRSDKRGAGAAGQGVGAHILSAMFPDDDSDVGSKLLDQRISLPQCEVHIACVDDEDGLGVAGPAAALSRAMEDEAGEEQDEGLQTLRDSLAGMSASAPGIAEESASINIEYAMLLPLWDQREDEDRAQRKRTRGVQWCKERLASVMEKIVAGGEEGVALANLDVAALGFAPPTGAEQSAAGKAERGTHVNPADSDTSGMELLNMALITLHNQGKILRVRGLDEHRYVSARWSYLWSLNREPARSKAKVTPTVAVEGAACASQDGKAADEADAGCGADKRARASKGGKSGPVRTVAAAGDVPADPQDGRGAGGNGAENQSGVEDRTREALVDGQVAGPWLTLADGDASNDDPLGNLRAAICETVYKHPGMPEAALAQRFYMLNPRTLGDVVAALEMEGALSCRSLVVPNCSISSAENPTLVARSCSAFPSSVLAGVGAAGEGQVKRFLFPRRSSLPLFLT